MIDQVVILVGGRGTRLGKLTDDCPKPMMDLDGRPFLDHLIARFVAAGVSDVILLAGYLAERIVDRYEGVRLGNARIRVLVEPEPLGTGGALTVCADRLAPQFLMANGDSLFAVDLAAFAVPLPEGATARLALRAVEDAGRYGRVRLEGEHIVEFAEKGAPGPGLINGGVYALRREVVDMLGKVPASIERDLFPVLAARRQLLGQAIDGYFVDIGIPADLARARAEMPKIFAAPPTIKRPDAG